MALDHHLPVECAPVRTLCMSCSQLCPSPSPLSSGSLMTAAGDRRPCRQWMAASRARVSRGLCVSLGSLVFAPSPALASPESPPTPTPLHAPPPRPARFACPHFPMRFLLPRLVPRVCCCKPQLHPAVRPSCGLPTHCSRQGGFLSPRQPSVAPGLFALQMFTLMHEVLSLCVYAWGVDVAVGVRRLCTALLPCARPVLGLCPKLRDGQQHRLRSWRHHHGGASHFGGRGHAVRAWAGVSHMQGCMTCHGVPHVTCVRVWSAQARLLQGVC